MNSEITIILDSTRAINPEMLIPPLQRGRLGGGKPEIRHKQIEIRIGSRPIARNLRTLYEKTGKAIPPELDLFVSHDLWLLTFSFGITQGNWIHEVTRVGFEVVFREPEVTVLSVLPDTRFIKWVDAELCGTVDLAANGTASLPDKAAQNMKLEEAMPFGGKVELSAEAGLAARLTFSVITPIIMAIGEADTRAEWIFLRDKKPLVGSQLLTLTALVPRGTKALELSARVYANVATFSFLPTMLRSKQVDIQCHLNP